MSINLSLNLSLAIASVVNQLQSYAMIQIVASLMMTLEASFTIVIFYDTGHGSFQVSLL
jgi:hypothetical protein